MISPKLVVEASQLTFQYKKKFPYILNNVSLNIHEGQIVGIMGLSGSGKSTLIQILNGIIPNRIPGHLSGQVSIHGQSINNQDVDFLARNVGTIFQDPDCQIIFPWAEDELAFGPENLCRPPTEILSTIDQVTRSLNIEHLRYANPNHLSGGQKQIIALASVLTLNVPFMILDESMSQIDDQGREYVKQALLTLKKEGKAILMVEHELENLSIADTIYWLENGHLKKREEV